MTRRDPRTGRFLPRLSPSAAPAWSVIAIGLEPIDPFGIGPDVPDVPLRREVLAPVSLASRPRRSSRWSPVAAWLAVVVPSVIYAWFRF